MVVEHFIIFTFCLIGASWTAYHHGVKIGAEILLDMLEEQKVVRVHEDGSVEPYK
jgi:hypothetical protein